MGLSTTAILLTFAITVSQTTGSTTIYEPTPYPEPIITDPEPAERVYVAMNEEIEIDEFQIKVVGAYYTDERDDYSGEAEHVLAIELEYITDKFRTSPPEYNFSLYGDDRLMDRYYLYSMYSPTVTPGRIGEMILGYDVPQGVSVIELEYVDIYDYNASEIYVFEIEVEE